MLPRKKELSGYVIVLYYNKLNHVNHVTLYYIVSDQIISYHQIFLCKRKKQESLVSSRVEI